LSAWCQKSFRVSPMLFLILSIALREADLGEPTSGFEPLTCSSYEFAVIRFV
jgi:hypothetical protein